ncbi:type II secretion system F family protein [Microbacterium sp. LRZ72]|uniref:type II secretion system F family protein n=1 Tax=Microbacterium sp. LRZ72 TaxID=2942481 RepID=UPI0029B32317|nr:type II secretion system F family protein [Microbacterium sp. LRZ72]MDX2377130.1 type II secretion system F family protein [Microbacterium sp. LRZ72]
MTLVQQFAYRALDSDGRGVVKGTVEAASEAAVAVKLKAQGLTALDVSPARRTGLQREITLPVRRRVRVRTLAVFAQQFAGLVNSGLPLLRALTIMVEQTEDRALQAALVTVHAEVQGGRSLSEAFARQPDAFPPLMVNLIRVGESGGFLGRSLSAVAKTYADEAALQDKIRAATTYPVIVLSIAVLALLAMVTFIVPIFEGMFSGMGGALPLPTRVLVTVSNNMFWILPLLVALAVGGTIWWLRHKDSDRVRRVIDPLTLRMPVFGPLATKIAVARFARSLAMMLDAGVPLLQALSVVGEASHNRVVARAAQQIQESVRQGRSFAGPLAASGVFPPMVAQMVSVGEESGTLAEMLGSIADLYEAEVTTATEQLTSTIEPLLIVVIGLLIGGMVIALYLPIFGIYGQLGQG